MKRTWSIAIVIVAVSAAVSAQSSREMDKPMMGDKPDTKYTGCIESVNHGGTFLLTHVADGHHMMEGQNGMNASGMEKKDGPGGSSGMQAEHMTPTSLVLTGTSDLKKHVGQKVTVTGSVSKGSMAGDMKSEPETLTVGSLKVVGKTCK
jgi:hypothetical protein